MLLYYTHSTNVIELLLLVDDEVLRAYILAQNCAYCLGVNITLQLLC